MSHIKRPPINKNFQIIATKHLPESPTETKGYERPKQYLSQSKFPCSCATLINHTLIICRCVRVSVNQLLVDRISKCGLNILHSFNPMSNHCVGKQPGTQLTLSQWFQSAVVLGTIAPTGLFPLSSISGPITNVAWSNLVRWIWIGFSFCTRTQLHVTRIVPE
jgi:hypothetical protein